VSLPAQLAVASGPGNASQATVSIAAGNTAKDVFVKFTDFTPVPGFAAADFTKATAFGVGLNGITTSFSLKIHRIDTASPN
jgi:hypothetical protein